jgi:hypothetical protein
VPTEISCSLAARYVIRTSIGEWDRAWVWALIHNLFSRRAASRNAVAVAALRQLIRRKQQGDEIAAAQLRILRHRCCCRPPALWRALLFLDTVSPFLKQFTFGIFGNAQDCEIMRANMTLNDFAHHRTHMAGWQCIQLDAIALELLGMPIALPFGWACR